MSQSSLGPWRRCQKEAGVSCMSERRSTRWPESMTLPKGEKHHFIIQCDSHPLSLSNMPYVPVTGHLARISGVTGLFTHCFQSDIISCKKKKKSIRHPSTVTGCQAEGIDPHRPSAQRLPMWGEGAEVRGHDGRCSTAMNTPNAQFWWWRFSSI